MEDLTGHQYGHWTVISQAPEQRINGRRGSAAANWLCRCDCSSQTEREVSEKNLVEHRSISCGCSRRKPTKKLNDLTGQKFGRWTVLHRAANRGENVYWRCRCNCPAQTERDVEARSLKGNRSESCGCLKDEKASERLKGKPSGQLEDLTGRTYGKWTVISLAERLYTDYGLRIMWNCKCDCGTERVVEASKLRGDHSQSCGCSPYFNDLAGKPFGRLTVLHADGRTQEGHVLWLVECGCENRTRKHVAGYLLVSGKVASCGCAQREGIVVRPEEVRKAKAAYQTTQYREDITFNLNRRMSAMIRLGLRREGTEKGGRHWPDMVGYTVDELREHLQITMPEGYTWDDYLAGILHIDHKIPLSAFNYERETNIDFKLAWALSNLQLLPGIDNLIKNDELKEPFQPSLAIG